MGDTDHAGWKVHVDYKRVVANLCPARRRRAWGVRPDGTVEFGVRTLTTVWGIVADLLVPVVFAGAWVSVLLLAEDIVTAARTAQGSP